MRSLCVFIATEESRRVYGFVAPSYSQEHYERVLERVNAVLPCCQATGRLTKGTAPFERNSRFLMTRFVPLFARGLMNVARGHSSTWCCRG